MLSLNTDLDWFGGIHYFQVTMDIEQIQETASVLSAYTEGLTAPRSNRR